MLNKTILLRSLGSEVRPFMCNIRCLSMEHFTGTLLERQHGFNRGSILEAELKTKHGVTKFLAKAEEKVEDQPIRFRIIQIDSDHQKLLQKLLT